MKNVSRKKKCNVGTVQVHVDPPLIPLIKSRNNYKWDKYFVKIKLRRHITSENSDFYELKTDLFDNGDPEEFFLFIRNSNMNLKASGTLKDIKKIQYLHTMVHVKALRQLDVLSDEVESASPENLTFIILGLSTSVFLLMTCPWKIARCATEWSVELSPMYSVLYQFTKVDKSRTKIYEQEISNSQTIKPLHTIHNLAH